MPSATLARLPAPLAAAARDVVTARRELFALTPPTPRIRIRVGPAAPPAKLHAWYVEAQRRYGVDASLLAAINMVESAFGRVRSPSGAGAQGPMQFLPDTWRRYGLGGDVHDPHDAILGAANYLARERRADAHVERALALQPVAALRRRRAADGEEDARRPPRVLRLLLVAGVRAHAEGRRAAHRPRARLASRRRRGQERWGIRASSTSRARRAAWSNDHQ